MAHTLLFRMFMNKPEPLLPPHGGYQKLKSFQIAQLVYDVTVRFCDKYISKFSRTHDQMVQAARSGVQNIAEGSLASGTSKKTEIKLTNVAKASLGELKLDYQDFLRQHNQPEWPPTHPALTRFKSQRCKTLADVQAWVVGEHRHTLRLSSGQADKHRFSQTNTDKAGTKKSAPCVSVLVHESPCHSVPTSTLVANAALSLLNLCHYLLTRQIQAQAAAFLNEGGFTERMYRLRNQAR